ncbi:type II CRISPR RNA-guided endonuclease Cas9 [Lactiplantibacillus garii]|uniref:CRISPR-associated endonuclease Cas9 n=1 Tax=Lactiplantibacillus garii TaxID=2306423 RepID=A0A3R8KJA7_9LACO|nr:type II CRISPR RNA-guided endonuclease Cas9 [Lactiplantibacillus garii]RRK10921.1 type II CRISPR RNA-guided endonuclease Cas9 [Lactiplantibacillus garii]
MGEPYGVGLDIGSNSVGWTVVDQTGHLIKVKGKTAIGARLFKEGEPAAERRSFRATRRRLKRVKWRLRLLREFFDQPVSKVDEDFFARRKYSAVSPRDLQYNGLAKTLFNDRTDKAFYDQYPTMYHLRQALMTEKRQFDVREIYLALHHIVKSRGNFLRNGSVADYQTVKLQLGAKFKAINELWAQIDISLNLQLTNNQKDLQSIKQILVRNDLSRSDQQKQITPLLAPITGTTADLKKRQKAVISEFAKALVGNKAKVDVLTVTEVDANAKKDWAFEMGDSQDALPIIEKDMSNLAQELMASVIELYAAVNLAQLIPEGKSFSQSMIDKYNHHHDDLVLFKAYLDSQTDIVRKHAIRTTYDHYIDGVKSKSVPQADFYKELEKFIKLDASENEFAAKIQQAISIEEFMPKLRTKQNGAIPYQVQQNEMDQIISNQKRYYPWLGEANPVKKRQGKFPYKLDELVGFRIPYYVGPLITSELQEKTANAQFAWMVRKGKGQITPWNFEEKVDREASATQFIQRMKTTDTYLLGEDVLPQHSLIYQRFMVLNELNKIKIDGQPITVAQKQRLYEQVFKQKKTVSVKVIQRNLVSAGEYPVEPKITGLADPKQFNSSLSTYYDLKKIIPEALIDSVKQDDIEKIIMWSTIFEDNEIFMTKLTTITWLSEAQRKALSHLRYRGWGQLSKKLLTSFRDENGRSILDELWATNHNFMELLSQESIAKQVTAANSVDLHESDLQDTINSLYTSPQNKKAIRQVMLVLADITNAMHGQAPSHVYIEAARGGGQVGRRIQARANQIQNVYKTTAKEIVDTDVKAELQTKVKDKATFTDRLVLYFMQNGRDLYTGKLINIDQLSNYDIDHILPQSLIKDDSLDNRVLTNAVLNREKDDNFASEKFGDRMGGEWRKLHQVGLISSRKLRHLTLRRNEINKYAEGFIHRQLVETRQVIKLITSLIDAKYPETAIVSVKADLTHQFRETFNFPKVREINNYHHAFDAYLTAFIGNYLLRRYPKLERFFVYGKFAKVPVTMNRFNVIEKLKSVTKPITIAETGEVLWDKDRDLAMFAKIYNFKRILVNREVYGSNAAMFNQTLYKASDNNSKTLIPKKKGMNTDIYGGYSSEKSAYLAIVKVPKKQSFEFKVMGIATRQLSQIKQLVASGKSEKEAVEVVIAPKFERFDKKTNAMTQDEFEVVLPKVRFEQVFRDDFKGKVHRFALGTNFYYHNIQELILKLGVQRKLRRKEATSNDLDQVFDATIKQVKRYFQLYENRGFRKKLLSKVDDFKQINDLELKKAVLNQLFIGLHANATLGDLRELGLGKDFGKLMLSGGIKLTENAEIIYQSPTGLFERKVALKDL